MRWGVVLCTCNDTLPVDAKAIGKGLGLAVPPAVFARLPRDEIHRFVALAARERTGCSAGRSLASSGRGFWTGCSRTIPTPTSS